MRRVLAFSPYNLKTLYPAFSRFLLETAKLGVSVELSCPDAKLHGGSRLVAYHPTWRIRKAKLHHLTFLISASWLILRAYWHKGKISVITLGPLSSLLFFLVLPIRRKVHFISYQPELHEDRLGFFLPIYRWISSNVDVFIDVDPKRFAIRQRHFGIKTKKTVILPNFFHLLQTDVPPVARIIKTSTDIKLVYGGALSEEHRLEDFLDVFIKIRTEYMRLHIYPIIYPGQENRLAMLMAAYQMSEGVHWHESVDHDSFLECLDEYDIGICCYPWRNQLGDGTLTENLNSKFAAPSKIYSYAARGLMVLTGCHPTLTRLIRKGMVQTFDYDDRKSLAAAIQAACEVIDTESREQRIIEFQSLKEEFNRKSMLGFINDIIY